MSYDIWLQIDTGGKEPAQVFEVGNYTSNVTPMWAMALGYPLSDLDNVVGEKAIEPLKKAVDHMLMNPAEYTQMNPANGWGNYRGAMNYLVRLLRGCMENPKATIRISR